MPGRVGVRHILPDKNLPEILPDSDFRGSPEALPPLTLSCRHPRTRTLPTR
jgi:hypothetical protein